MNCVSLNGFFHNAAGHNCRNKRFYWNKYDEVVSSECSAAVLEMDGVIYWINSKPLVLIIYAPHGNVDPTTVQLPLLYLLL